MLLYSYINLTLKKSLGKKRDENYTRMLHTLLNKCLKQHPIKTARLQPFTYHLKKKKIQVKKEDFYTSRKVRTNSLAISRYEHTSVIERERLIFINSTGTLDSVWSTYQEGCPRGVMVKAMNCGIVVREFVLQSRYYVHFRANTLGKGMNPLILPPAMGK